MTATFVAVPTGGDQREDALSPPPAGLVTATLRDGS
jgi:hypothetical protein